MITHRHIVEISGKDRSSFLQGLISNDLTDLGDDLRYAAMLTAQGKYLADFFIFNRKDSICLDVANSRAPLLLKKFQLYRLRADIEIKHSEQKVTIGKGNRPTTALTDPRHPELGWRYYGPESVASDLDDTIWQRLRVAYGIPETDIELTDESYILEMGFERLMGVDFRKGCYVGQEVTARMKHKTQLRKGLAQILLTASPQCGEAIIAADRPIGTVYSTDGRLALAHLRFDRTNADLSTRSGARIVKATPVWEL